MNSHLILNAAHFLLESLLGTPAFPEQECVNIKYVFALQYKSFLAINGYRLLSDLQLGQGI